MNELLRNIIVFLACSHVLKHTQYTPFSNGNYHHEIHMHGCCLPLIMCCDIVLP